LGVSDKEDGSSLLGGGGGRNRRVERQIVTSQKRKRRAKGRNKLVHAPGGAFSWRRDCKKGFRKLGGKEKKNDNAFADDYEQIDRGKRGAQYKKNFP